MVPGRSAETSRELADERAVRTFLERAAPIILETRTLDGERFEAVLALAEEIGLTREQLSCELRFLELRGVISSAPWSRLDVPEDSPEGRTGPPAPAPPARKTAERPAETAPQKPPDPPRSAPPPLPSRHRCVQVRPPYPHRRRGPLSHHQPRKGHNFRRPLPRPNRSGGGSSRNWPGILRSCWPLTMNRG